MNEKDMNTATKDMLLKFASDIVTAVKTAEVDINLEAQYKKAIENALNIGGGLSAYQPIATVMTDEQVATLVEQVKQAGNFYEFIEKVSPYLRDLIKTVICKTCTGGVV